MKNPTLNPDPESKEPNEGEQPGKSDENAGGGGVGEEE